MTLERYNELCDEHCYYDDRIYYMEELADLLYVRGVNEVLNIFEDSIWRHEFTHTQNYCKFTFYGVESSDDWEELAEQDILDMEDKE